MDVIFLQFQDISIRRDWLLLGAVLFFVTMSIFVVGFAIFGVRSGLGGRISSLRENKASDNSKPNSRFKDTLESLSPIYISSDIKERESIRHKLMHAGYHEKSALANFYALKFLSFSLGVFGSGVCYIFISDSSQIYTLMGASIFLGLVFPNYVLQNKSKARQSRIRSGIPDALDLLVVCTESGLGFLAALKRVSNEVYISHPDLADELETICAKVKAGVEIPQAFSDLVTRTGLTELNGLVSMLSHASRIGGSLASTLRDYNEDYRDRRTQAAEELAAKIPTKMVFPMLLFIWPCFFIVAIGPAILSLIKAFE